jgi:hypothetical protein
VSIINVKKYRRRAPWEVLPENLGVPTINARNVDGGPPRPPWGIRSPSGIRKVRCDLHRHNRQKVIWITGPILIALSSIMVNDP